MFVMFRSDVSFLMFISDVSLMFLMFGMLICNRCIRCKCARYVASFCYCCGVYDLVKVFCR